jgi:hypothetical protein
MDLRTTFNIAPSPDKITYNDPVMFIGSCFATSIGLKFEAGHLPVMINPSGTVYNPYSVSNTLDSITDGKDYSADDLYNYNGICLSFNHSMDFSSETPGKAIESINHGLAEARKFLTGARFLFVTFGTARVYRLKKTGKIVSNCHKIAAAEFTNELMSVNDIAALWKDQLDRLYKLFPLLKVVFTISPVRHWKDGAHGNQVSKSVLFLAVEELLKHPSEPGYFPAYELLMDDLRDYRFYDDDMLHPSSAAVDYIWNAFSECWFDSKTTDLWQEVNKITKAYNHRVQTGKRDEIKSFAEKIISRIDVISAKMPKIKLDNEKEYFLGLTK